MGNRRRGSREEFIEKANAHHNFKYEYPEFEYKGRYQIIRIKCPEHTYFHQSLSAHLKTHGCLECSVKNEKFRKKLTRKTQNEIIGKFREIHSDTYNYNLTEYGGMRVKVKIICPKEGHGIFIQKPCDHIQGRGCPKCGYDKISISNGLTIKEFIRRAIEFHGNTYNYSLVEYISTNTKVKIICQIEEHGIFEQLPLVHLKGSGCQQCSNEKRGWNYSNWNEFGKNSKHFDSFKVYIIECWSNDTSERFYKVGKTFQKLKKRFSDKNNMPYKYKVVKVIESSDGVYISKLEHKIHKINIQNKYIPLINFGGSGECFSKIDECN